ncbi:MAG: hypothetical protein RLZZ450_1593 [Pseudomonadota bacterium]|jgi:prepilin peptidase CpaA
MTEPSIYSLLLTALLTAVAAAWDLRTGEIPNRLVAIGGAACVSAAVAAGVLAGGWAILGTLLSMVLGAVLVSVVPLILFRAGGIGGGDVKLLAVVGLVLGPYLGLQAELYAFVVAMLYAPARLIWDGRFIHAVKTIGVLTIRPFLPKHRRPDPVPLEELTALRFGPAIFVGTLLTTVPHLAGLR